MQHFTTEFKRDSKESYKGEKEGFLSFCELWTNIFVSYGQRYAQLFFILSDDLQMHLGL